MEMPVFEKIQTLPDSFNSMIGQSIDIGTDHARELIGILGKKLGIEDYRSNLATFWLLDTMALEVTRMNHRMNSMDLGILVSWIAGEAKLIRDNQFSRVEFFKEMDSIFAKVSGQLGKGKPLIYWEEITDIDSSPNERQVPEDAVASRSNSKLEYNLESKNSGDTIERIRSVDSSNEETITQKSYTVLASSMEVLEAIIESTYAVYAKAFHYESASAAFAKSIEIRPYRLPYTLRFPRVVKPPVLPSVKNGTTNKGLRGKERSKRDEGIPTKNKVKEKTKSKSPAEISPPILSVADQEMVPLKSDQILPLMESNEAPRLLEQFAKPLSINLFAETKSGRKGKRKI